MTARREFLLASIVPFLATPRRRVVATDHVAELTAAWTRGCLYTLEVAEAFPADDFGYRPSPEVRTVGDALLHIAIATRGWSALIRDVTLSGSPLPAAHNRAAVIELLRLSAEEGRQAHLALVDRGDKRIAWSRRHWTGTTVSMWEVAATMRDHATHHRAQLVVYLRLRGISPPAYVD